MIKEPSDKFMSAFVSWCKARGIRPHISNKKRFLEMVAKQTKQQIDQYERLGCPLVPNMQMDGSVKFYTIEQARQHLEKFKQLFRLE